MRHVHSVTGRAAHSILDGGEGQAGKEQQHTRGHRDAGQVDVAHGFSFVGSLLQTQSKRSVWMRSAGAPIPTNAVSTAASIGVGPHAKNWNRRKPAGRWRARMSASRYPLS